MDNYNYISNQDVPHLKHKNWSSLALECGSNSNLKTIQEPYNYHNGLSPHFTTSNIDSEFVNHCQYSSPCCSYKTPSFSIFDVDSSTKIKPAFETFDYNHCDIPYGYNIKVKSSPSEKICNSSTIDNIKDIRSNPTLEKAPPLVRVRKARYRENKYKSPTIDNIKNIRSEHTPEKGPPSARAWKKQKMENKHKSSTINDIKDSRSDTTPDKSPPVRFRKARHRDNKYRFSTSDEIKDIRPNPTPEKSPTLARIRKARKRENKAAIRAINKKIITRIKKKKIKTKGREKLFSRTTNDKKSFQIWVSELATIRNLNNRDDYLPRVDAVLGSSKKIKGLPKWIVDDIKKINEREQNQALRSKDFMGDGDTKLADVVRDANLLKLSKKVSIPHSATETDLDDAIPQDDSGIMENIDYSSLSLPELIEMLDNDELHFIKIMFIRNSLTDIMKEITDGIIFGVVKSAFRHQLNGGKKKCKNTNAHKKGLGESVVATQSSKIISQLLGLDVYESEGDNDEESPNVHSESESPDLSESDDDDDYVEKRMKLEPELLKSEEPDYGTQNLIDHSITEIKLELALMELGGKSKFLTNQNKGPVMTSRSTTEINSDSITKNEPTMSHIKPCKIKSEPYANAQDNVSLASSSKHEEKKCTRKRRNLTEPRRKIEGYKRNILCKD